MKPKEPTDFETYCEIMDDLLRPIQGDGLDWEVMKKLYESKLVYLENLRSKCFFEMNKDSEKAFFSLKDYELIIKAIKVTKTHLHDLIVLAVYSSLHSRKVQSSEEI